MEKKESDKEARDKKQQRETNKQQEEKLKYRQT